MRLLLGETALHPSCLAGALQVDLHYLGVYDGPRSLRGLLLHARVKCDIGCGHLSTSEFGGLACIRHDVIALSFIGVCSVDVSTHGDDPLWPWDLELEVFVTGVGNKLGVVEPPRYHMLRAWQSTILKVSIPVLELS